MLRFAPSPTGDMHIGHLRIAIVNAIAAKQRGERFVVRMEDTDAERNVEGKDREILEILRLFHIEYDDLLYQSHNLTIHQHMAIRLLQERKAFACFCTDGELEAEREAAEREKRPCRYSGRCEALSDAEVLSIDRPFTIRLKKPAEPICFEDPIGGELRFEPDEIDSFVILRSDKSPTPDFACAVDDMIQDIGFVIRDREHLGNTPRQIHVRRMLGYDRPVEYIHLPPIRYVEGADASKADLPSVRELLLEGFLPEAIANCLIPSGNGTPAQIATLDQAVGQFEPESLCEADWVFDRERLRSLNVEHMKRMDAKELSRAFGFADAAIGELAKRYLGEESTIRQIRPRIEAIFAPKPFDGPSGDAMRRIRDAVKESPHFEDFDTFVRHLAEKTGLADRELLEPLRLLLTGTRQGPELSELYPYLKSYLMEIVK